MVDRINNTDHQWTASIIFQPEFITYGKKMEVHVGSNVIPQEADIQRKFFEVVSSETFRLLDIAGDHPVRTLSALEAWATPSPIPGWTEELREDKSVQLVIIEGSQKDYPRAVIITFEVGIVCGKEGALKLNISIPRTESLPHVDTIGRGIFDRMILEGKSYEQAVADMKVEFERKSVKK